MIPTNDLHAFAQYKFIRTVRQSDGAVLIATRDVKDIKLPVRWDVDENEPKPFKAPVLEVKTLLSTSQLIENGRRKGYGDWYPIAEKMEEVFPFDALGDDLKVQRVPKYPEPDTTDYLVD